MSHIVTYVSKINVDSRVHGNSKAKDARTLGSNIPLLGPVFAPPTHLHQLRRKGPTDKVVPQTSYIKKLHIIHPFFYPDLPLSCPECNEVATFASNGWTGGAPRKVHALKVDELAYGLQYQCGVCEKNKRSYGFSTTNPEFWKGTPHWALPSASFFKLSLFARSVA